MKSATLISEDGRLMTEVASALQQLGAKVSHGERDYEVHWQDRRGRQMYLYWAFSDGNWRDYPGEELTAADGVTVPNLSVVTGCIVECRWAEWFISTMEHLSKTLPFPIWVLDTDSVLWSADAVDAERLVL